LKNNAYLCSSNKARGWRRKICEIREISEQYISLAENADGAEPFCEIGEKQ